ncbi:ABC transporter substrate-binding protein [Marispirochaeta aestuarii]|uniref:ABC transporter substrate-binding protein n=1 Tax=Marispirochaeta aestuarii TaxID=1963862 RepID=A0A1Y1RXD7_9SPIO|nr:multiple monosaccharide ABC transporter substrate-binding protein [Marispirochaeta aestuarii]ORC35042.1 ABC transporter substrate-binding protein [Marispirochaeta aestuarii]
MKNALRIGVLCVLLVLLAFPIFAAGGQEEGTAKKVGILMPTKSLQRWNQDGQYLKSKLEAKGYKVDLQYANNQVATQVSQLENLVTAGNKILVIASIDSTALKGALAQAKSEGCLVIAYDRLIMDTENVDYYATFDNYKVGTLQGNFIVEELGLKSGKGPYNLEVFGGSPDDNNAYLFNQGAMDQLQPYIDKGQLVINSGQTEMSVIAISAWKAEGAQARMDNLLTAYYADKKVDVVLSPNDSLAQGIVASLKSAGYGTASKPYPVLTGQDCDKINVKMMINGEQSMSVFKDTRTLAERVVTMVSEIGEGKKVTVNDTESYDNNVKVVPSFLCDPVFADKNNYKELLIDSGYYTIDEIM